MHNVFFSGGRALQLLLTALVALSWVAPPARAWATSPVVIDPEFFGMVVRDPYYDYDSYPGRRGPNTAAQDEMGRRLAELGVRWVRFEFIGENIGGKGQVNFERYDYFINTVAPKYNLKLLGLLATNILQGDPVYWQSWKLNTEPLTDTLRPEYGGAMNTYMRRWLDEALRVAGRYQGKVQAFELFNEANRLLGDGTGLPDKDLQYAGLDPVRVGRLHAKFYRICKNTDGQQTQTLCPATTQIILGGLHPKGTSNRRDPDKPETFKFSDRKYLELMYGEGAFLDFKKADSQGRWPVDGIGYHPYPEEITAAAQSVESDMLKIQARLNGLRTALTGLGDGNRPFWITEIGYNAGFWAVRNREPEPEQARFMHAAFTQLWARGDVANVFWFKYEDFPPANPSSGVDPQRWGVVRIPFREGDSSGPPKVNGIPCAGGACYEPAGKPDKLRLAYFTYRELSGLPIQRASIPQILR